MSRALNANPLDATALSPRLMFSATPLAPVAVEDPSAGVEVVVEQSSMIDEAPNDNTVQPTQQTQSQQQQARLELVFVDSSVEDYQSLIDEIAGSDTQSELQIYLIDGTKDGIEQISEILEGYQDVDALHLLSHGNDGTLKLGSSVLDEYSLAGYAGELAKWQSSLSEQADLMIYGCELAETGSGQTLLAAISELTGADIAASSDDTGHSSLGGDWDLEFVIGQTETSNLAQQIGNPSWVGLLTTPELTPTGELRVNDVPAQDQELQSAHQSVAVDGNGNSVVVYVDHQSSYDGSDIFFLRFDSDGNRIGTPTRVSVNDAGDQSDPVVAMDSSGRFAIAWVADDANGTGIFVRRFDQNGTAIDGNDILVNTLQETGDQSGVSITCNDNDQIVIAWESDGASEGIFARTFDFTSTPALSQLATTLITVDTEASATGVAVDINQTGRYAIGWNDSTDLWGIRYDYGSSTPVNAKRDLGSGFGTRRDIVVGMQFNDDYVVAYRSEALLFQGVWFKIVEDGGSISAATRVTTSSSADFPTIDVAENDRFVIAYSKPDADETGIYYQAFDASGSKIGSEIAVNQSTNGTQELASIAVHDVNNLVVAWSGEGEQVSNVDTQGVFFRQFGRSNAVPVADPNAGAPYTIVEGDSLTLDGTDSSDGDGDTLSFAWDLDNDGIYGEAGEPTTASATISWATLQSFGIDDDGSYTIGLQVDDGFGGVSTQTTTLTVQNKAPTVTASGPSSILVGNTYTLTLSATDPGNDSITSWRVDWGDGTTNLYLGASTTVTHTYNVLGLTHNILVSATDEDGVWHQGDVFIGSEESDEIARYDFQTGGFEVDFGSSVSIEKATDFVIGRDGLLYVTGLGTDNVQRFNPDTGAWIDEFVASGSGGLSKSTGIAFGRDGNLYVGDYDGDRILRYDATNGNFIDAFVTSGSGGLDAPSDIWFGSDGNLYVVGNKSDNVSRYDGTTGAFIDEFIAAGSGGLSKPFSAALGRDGRIYVSSEDTDSILRYDGTTGAFVDTFVASGANGLNKPSMIAFGPDDLLYVTNRDEGEILRYDASGTFVDVYLSGIDKPRAIVFTPDLQVTVVATNSAATATNLTQAINYTEDASSVALGDIVVSDPDLGEVVTAQLKLDLPATGALTTGTYGSLTSTYSSATGLWQAVGSVADVNAALADVAFVPTADNVQTSQIVVHIEDSTGAGPADGLIQLNPTPVNDAPTIDLDQDDSSGATGGAYTDTFTEGDAAVLIVDATDGVIGDIDSSNLTSLTVSIANIADGSFESLTVDTSGTSISASYSAGVLTLTGTDTTANYQQVLRTIRYINTSDAPTTTARRIVFVASDGADNSSAVTSTIQVAAVNDPPSVTVPAAQTASEDSWLAISGISVSDSDIGAGIIEVTFSVSQGRVFINPFVPFGVNTSHLTGNNSDKVVVRSTLAELNTTLAAVGVSYTGNSNFNGSDVMRIKADDSSAMTIETVAIAVQPVNDNPQASGDRYNTSRDSNLVVASNGVLGNDTDIDGDTLSAVLISGPTSGSVTLNPDGSFIYRPTTTTSGLVTFTYAVSDGTVQSSPATVQILVTVPIIPPAPALIVDDIVPEVEPPSADTTSEPEQQSSAEQTGAVAMVAPPAAISTTAFASGGTQVTETSDEGMAVDQLGEVALTVSDDLGELDEDVASIDRNDDYVARQRLAIRSSSISVAASVWGEFDSEIFWNDLDKVQEQINDPTETTLVVAGTFAGFSSALSVGYVVWTVRGGLLATSLLAHLPAWSFVDPLLVLSDLEGDEDEFEDDSLENMIEKKQAEHDANDRVDEPQAGGGEER
ncbi:DUF4347 domain-containing protein [Stieleria sp. JC731]|uniref:DUF4347 domain-containing protein n=1 Tax=Pirellulaceae TaxID=2691357 RepID=UPI001E2F6F7D|nr:DUF4347 domain-containing protein [Stieleria sp. JC731]MCC9599924.1 DUF4347 domain-containing protein [Stieleria sp. JC731]